MSAWAAGPWLVFLIPLVIIAGVLLGRHYFWQKRIVHILGSTQLKNFSLSKAFIKGILRFLGLLFLVAALARPQWGEKEQTIEQQGRDVLIALDISRSMLAQDVLPSRLEAAKNKIREILSRLTAERVSLMVFSGAAVVLCPFTKDMGAFLTFLDLADAEAISTGTTALGQAIDLGVKTFASMPDRKQRIMMLFTDGEDFSMDESVAQRAKEAGLHILAVGVGTPEGAPIPLYDINGKQQGHLHYEGSPVITKLNEERLMQIAKETEGRYVRITKNDEDSIVLINEIQRYEKETFDDTTISGKEERYLIFASLSLLALILEWIL